MNTILKRILIIFFVAAFLTAISYFFISNREMKESLFIGILTSILSTFLMPVKNTNSKKWKKLYKSIIVVVIVLLVFIQFLQKGNINFQVLLLVGIIGVLLTIPLIYFIYWKKKKD